MSGLGLLWALIKSLRYVLPFLREVTDENGVTDDKELERIRNLKSVMHSGLWKVFYIIVLTAVVVFGIFPLYSKNAVLELEIAKNNTYIASLKQEIKTRDNDNRKLSADLASRNADVKNGDEAYKRLLDVLNTCRVANAEYRHFVLSLDNLTLKDKANLPQDAKNAAKQDKDKKGLGGSLVSEETRKKLETLKEGD